MGRSKTAVLIAAICFLVLVLAAVYAMRPRTYTYARILTGGSPLRTLTSSPTPMSTSHCWIYDKIYPATNEAFKSQHLTSAERQEIERWAKSVVPRRRQFVRWMRDPSSDDLFIFVAQPLYPKIPTPWQALNTNIVIDAVTCEVGAFPKS